MNVLRIVWGRVEPDRLSALAAAFIDATQHGSPVDGLIAWHLGTRPSGDHHEVAGLTVWDTVDHALAAFAGDLASNRTLAQLDAVADFSGADFYEIEAAHIRIPTDDAAFLRVATGTLPSGPEAEILGEMRRRLTSIGVQVAEGYVGRRLRGNGVEAVFVSVWEGVPDRASLDDPIWPDLAARKEDFSVRTFFAARGGLRGSPADPAAIDRDPDAAPPGDEAMHWIRLHLPERRTSVRAGA